jgi:hypothetical protein
MATERTIDGNVPLVLILHQAGAFVRTSDVPAPHIVHRYAR